MINHPLLLCSEVVFINLFAHIYIIILLVLCYLTKISSFFFPLMFPSFYMLYCAVRLFIALWLDFISIYINFIDNFLLSFV